MDIGIIKIKRNPISIEEYKYGNFTRIENAGILRDIFYSYGTRELIYLTNNNKELFLNKFGRQDFVFTGEYKNYAWGFNFKSGILLVFTGNKGTSYEFQGTPKERDAKELKNLFDFIIKNNPKLNF